MSLIGDLQALILLGLSSWVAWEIWKVVEEHDRERREKREAWKRKLDLMREEERR